MPVGRACVRRVVLLLRRAKPGAVAAPHAVHMRRERSAQRVSALRSTCVCTACALHAYSVCTACAVRVQVLYGIRWEITMSHMES